MLLGLECPILSLIFQHWTGPDPPVAMKERFLPELTMLEVSVLSLLTFVGLLKSVLFDNSSVNMGSILLFGLGLVKETNLEFWPG